MSDFLAKANTAAADRVASARSAVSLQALRDREAPREIPAFAAALGGPGVGLIAEVKRASPSRGDIAPIPDAAALATAYVRGGAAAVSVLTEPQWFKGALDDLEAVAAGNPGTPVLRKDFLVDAYQVWEARAHGAAAVLLIVAALAHDELVGLLSECAAAGLDALIETHGPDEIVRAAEAHRSAGVSLPLVVGVNARNLSTLDVDRGRFAALRALLPASAIAVAESGIKGAADVDELRRLGADAVLVGEYLAGADDPERAAKALVEAGRGTFAFEGAPEPAFEGGNE